MTLPVPKTLDRLATEVQGWLELGRPDRALHHLEPLLASPGARPFGLGARVRALIMLGEIHAARATLDELRPFEDDRNWFDLTEAWCRKHTGDLQGAIVCMERYAERAPQSGVAHFNLGCCLAIAGNLQRALAEIELACELEGSLRDLLADETDLEPLRGNPRLEQLKSSQA